MALELYFDVVSTDEEEVVASKEVQQIKEKYHPSFSFIIFDISVPNHGVCLGHKILLKLSS